MGNDCPDCHNQRHQCTCTEKEDELREEVRELQARLDELEEEQVALVDQARREGFRAGRRSKEGCVVNIDYGRKGLGAFEYLTEDDYIESLKEKE